VTGISNGGTSANDYATVAYNAGTGAQLWATRYNGPGNGSDDVRQLVVSPAGDTVFVTGQSDGGATAGYDAATVAYNAATGETRWVKRYNGPLNGNDGANSVGISPAGDTVFVTGGSANGGLPPGEGFVTIAYDAATGSQLWVKRYNGDGVTKRGGYAVSLAVSPGGGAVYVTGIGPATTSGDDYVTAGYNAATGATLWTRRYNGPANGTDQPSSVAASPSGIWFPDR